MTDSSLARGVPAHGVPAHGLPAQGMLAQAVLAQAARTPTAVAVEDGDRRLDYAGLAAASAAVAASLHESGVRPGDAVAVCLTRSQELVCTMLGVLRTGATVVPLDAQSPPERRRHILTDAGCAVVVTDAGGMAELPEQVRALPVSALLDVGAFDTQPPDTQVPDTQATDTQVPDAESPDTGGPIAFVFYTSGTTGRPKGVEVPDAAVLRLARPGYLRLADARRFGCLSNPAFDALSFEVWVPLLTGGCCVILDEATVAAPERFAAALLAKRVDTMFITAALFNAVVDQLPHCFAGVGQLLVGGDQLNAALIKRWYRDNPDSPTQLYNGYGPTETATFALSYAIPRDFDADLVPIGRPLPGTEAVLVSSEGQQAGDGETAELYIGGEAVAAGYRNLAEETDRRFVRLPWVDGGRTRFYGTGDLVRRTADGLVEYLGRTDRQVKVRGFRIEPAELERQLVRHPAVSQAYVGTRRTGPLGSTELLAYLVLSGPLSFADYERHLAESLPSYMRPHQVHLVDALPLTANGKVDADALLARDEPPWRGEDSQSDAPTDWQREVLALAGDVLGVRGLRAGDRWIASGGDSLKALRLRYEVRQRWGSELPAGLVLQSDLGQLADAIDAGRHQTGSPYPAVVPAPDARSAPATSEQQRLWLLQQQNPASVAYNVGLAFRLTGAVELSALRQALRRLVVRYPALRTGYAPTGDGLRQVVGEPYDPWYEPDRPSGEDWRRVAERLLAEPFDLSEPLMLQACWLSDQTADARTSDGVLLLRLHHIAVDGWSVTLLLQALSGEYAAALSGVEAEPAEVTGQNPTPLDFARWQSEWFGRPAYANQRSELRAHYSEQEPSSAPLHPLTRTGKPADRLLHVRLDQGRRQQLDRLGAELGLTRFQLLLGIFACSVYGVTGRDRPLIASPVANRPVAEFEASVGMFANTVLMPLRLVPAEELRDQLRRHGQASKAVLDRQEVALADVLSDHRFSDGGPLFDFLFVLENTDYAGLALPGCTSRPEWLDPAQAKCALTLTVVEDGDALDCLWEYAGSYLDEDDAHALAALFSQALDWLVEGRTATLADLVAGYRNTLPEAGRGRTAELSYATVAEGFDRQVRRTPQASALAVGGRTVSYAELDAYAGALAAELRANYPLPADHDQPCCVALHLEASVEHVVALLALARLNLTIVPLDPEYPPEQLRHVLSQIEPLCVLLPPDSAATIDTGSLPRHPVRLRATAGLALPAHDGRRPLYTLFTSGSTGTPKGVAVFDRLLCNLLQWQASDGGLAPAAVTQQFSMLSFDVSFQEIFGTLCGGGCLHLIDPGWRQDAPALLDQLENAGIERVFMPYVALQLLAEHAVLLGRYPRRLREVVTAGEQLLCTQAIRTWLSGMPGARLFNHYGPTETHVVSALCLDGDPANWPVHPAIGEPVANIWLRVVDQAGQVVPPDCPGQLLIGGPLVAPCYLDDPELNRARFLETPAGWFFRTGDQARFDRQGLLHFLGRDDGQVKVSGHRLELGEVEAALLRHPAITGAVVVRDGDQLVANLQLRGDTPSVAELAEHLAPLVPPYVRINRFRRLASLPRTASGKLDRRRMLAAPGEELRAGGDGAGLSAREAQLAELFEAVIGSPIEVDQRFFDAGASSLGLMRFHLRLTAELGATLSIADLFEHVTIRRLARFVDGGPPTRREPAGTSIAERPAAGAAPGTAEPIAVIGMAVRLPGADDLAGFWDLVRTGGRGIEHFEAADGLVGARSQLSGLLAFDPGHFGISRQEARLMDPQQRHLLMCCVQALAHAGIGEAADLAERGQRVGLVASCGENTYFQSMLREGDPAQLPDSFQLALHHDKDFLATKAAYHLGLTGPAFTVQAACSSSLVGVHLAAGLLAQGDSEVMLVGGVLVDPLLSQGYEYRPQHIFSPDGHCRPFSDDAGGTIGGSGVGVVVLKPLRLARADGDTVYSVITGSAINNDGSAKLSYSAPALAGQREVIRAALRRSGRTSAELGYVEAHGTGTRLGDPVEVGALRQAYDLPGAGQVALASVKSQIGHLGAAAGVVGLVRATLAVHHGVIPPNVDFSRPNPELGFVGTAPAPFYIPTEALPWPADRPRVAAVSSFGIGGTNSHLVLEAAEPTRSTQPAPTASTASIASIVSTVPLLMLSAGSAGALRADADRIAGYLADHPGSYPEVLRHLQAGRPAQRWRMAACCPEPAGAVAWLRSAAAVLVQPGGTGELDGSELNGTTTELEADRVAALATGWLAGATINWPAGPAQPPWNFPPPAFELTEFDFARAAQADLTTRAELTARTELTAQAELTARPEPAAPLAPVVPRLPEDDWLSQPQWARWRRAGTARPAPTSRLLVVLTAEPLPAAALAAFRPGYARVVRVSASSGYGVHGTDAYQVDPTDPASLALLLRELDGPGSDGIDWLHALPLAVDGPVGTAALERARWACLDTPAALLQALDGLRASSLRIWWLSAQGQSVDGDVGRPEVGLLAGISEVGPQESGIDARWLDLPGPNVTDWAGPLAALLADAADSTPHRLALRQGYWWHQQALPVQVPGSIDAMPVDGGVYLVLGGTGGIGSSIAAWLLDQADCRLVLLSRKPELPASLERWADRIELAEADLGSELVETVLSRLGRRLPRLDGVVHAAGAATGSLIARRDAEAMRAATAAKLAGCLLIEGLIQRYQPAFAAYCSSMSALLGGIGQLDYAAGNGALDGFARHRGSAAETTARLGIDFDIWSEVGMAQAAQQALRSDARHQAHLAVGLSVAEGQRVFARALQLQLPQLLVSTTSWEQSRAFYAPSASNGSDRPVLADAGQDAGQDAPIGAEHPVSVAEQLSDCLCRWLGVDQLDPAASLYDLGADSLVLLDLIGEVKQRFGVDIELARLSHRASLAEVLAQYEAISGTAATTEPAPTDSASSQPAVSPAAAAELVALDVWQAGTGDDLLCLIHPVGGDIQAYRSLVSALDPRLTVCLIADPALYRPELPPWSLAERARHYATALHSRFPRDRWRWRLAGWSFGGWVALTMAADCEAASQPVAGLYLLDPPPPGSGVDLQSYDEDQLRTMFALELGSNSPVSKGQTVPNGRTSDGEASNSEVAAYAERLARCCRANLASMAGHRLPALTGTPVELWLATRPVPGLPAPLPAAERQRLWQPLLPGLAGSNRCHALDTTHDGVVRAPAVDQIAALVGAGSLPMLENVLTPERTS